METIKLEIRILIERYRDADFMFIKLKGKRKINIKQCLRKFVHYDILGENRYKKIPRGVK